MKNPDWWTDKVFLVLVLSGFLLICNGGFLYIYIVWGLYLASGWKVVKNHPSDSNTSEFAGQLVLGVIVCLVATIITIAAHIRY